MAQHADAGRSTLPEMDRRRFLQMTAVLGAAAGGGDLMAERRRRSGEPASKASNVS